MIRLKATELDVYVDNVHVGTVFDCGDYWRARMTGCRRRKSMPDYDCRSDAIRGVVLAAAK